jgi:hypothetical protein
VRRGGVSRRAISLISAMGKDTGCKNVSSLRVYMQAAAQIIGMNAVNPAAKQMPRCLHRILT